MKPGRQLLIEKGEKSMKHIQTLDTRDMAKSAVNGGCGECQTSCQSACKTSCGIANQACENTEE
jgi:predicted ribosomally synthesized six-cysteine peptide SCIFF